MVGKGTLVLARVPNAVYPLIRMLRALLFLVLAASLAANVWFILQSRRTAAASEQIRAVPKPPETPVVSAPDPGAVNLAASLASRPTTAAEFKAIRARLEALGLPPLVVRNVLFALLQRSFQARFAALQGQPGPDEYWRNPGVRHVDSSSAAFRELANEQRRLLREVVGDDLESDEDGLRRQFGGLPEGKVAQLKRIMADYAELEEQLLFADGSDRSSTDMRARAALLAREKRADIERLLTPEELLNYDLRNSPAAHRLRSKLGQFAATEAEFRTLYPFFKSTLDAVTAPDPRTSPAEARRARETAERQLDEQLRRVLGEARYAELQEVNDHLLQQTRAFTASLNLPPHVASEVIAVQKEYSPRLQALDRDRDLTPNQRDARVSALGLEARDRLIRALGPAGFEAYKRQGGGWLGAALSRTPPTPSPAP